MSIFNKDLRLFKQDFSCKDGNKEKYGEVNTDFRLVEKIIGLLPDLIFADPHLKWLDPCAGKGYFTMILYERLFKSLSHDTRRKPDTWSWCGKSYVIGVSILGSSNAWNVSFTTGSPSIAL